MAKFLQDRGFKAGSRAAIIMTNQSCWPIAAYAVFYAGGVLVPIDYKLTAPECLALLAHSKAEVLITEYHLWRAITQLEPGKVSGAVATGSASDRSLPLPELTTSPRSSRLFNSFLASERRNVYSDKRDL